MEEKRLDEQPNWGRRLLIGGATIGGAFAILRGKRNCEEERAVEATRKKVERALKKPDIAAALRRTQKLYAYLTRQKEQEDLTQIEEAIRLMREGKIEGARFVSFYVLDKFNERVQAQKVQGPHNESQKEIMRGVQEEIGITSREYQSAMTARWVDDYLKELSTHTADFFAGEGLKRLYSIYTHLFLLLTPQEDFDPYDPLFIKLIGIHNAQAMQEFAREVYEMNPYRGMFRDGVDENFRNTHGIDE